jgi:hypothetical protein
MNINRKPSGFVAVCQCGRIVGALDWERTERAEAGRLLGAWLSRGCTVSPRFTTAWSATIEACACDAEPAAQKEPQP